MSDGESLVAGGVEDHFGSASPVRRPGLGSSQRPALPSSVDAALLSTLDSDAHRLAVDVDNILVTLQEDLHRACDLSAKSAGAYKIAVDGVSDQVDVCIKSMASLISRCEELDRGMSRVVPLFQQIKRVRQQLMSLDAALAK